MGLLKPLNPYVPHSSVQDEPDILGDTPLETLEPPKFTEWGDLPPPPGPVTTDIAISPNLLTGRQLEGIDAIPGLLTATLMSTDYSGTDELFAINVVRDANNFIINIQENLLEGYGGESIDALLVGIFNDDSLRDQFIGLNTEDLYSHIRGLIMESGGTKISISISPTGG